MFQPFGAIIFSWHSECCVCFGMFGRIQLRSTQIKSSCNNRQSVSVCVITGVCVCVHARSTLMRQLAVPWERTKQCCPETECLERLLFDTLTQCQADRFWALTTFDNMEWITHKSQVYVTLSSNLGSLYSRQSTYVSACFCPDICPLACMLSPCRTMPIFFFNSECAGSSAVPVGRSQNGSGAAYNRLL